MPKTVSIFAILVTSRIANRFQHLRQLVSYPILKLSMLVFSATTDSKIKFDRKVLMTFDESQKAEVLMRVF